MSKTKLTETSKRANKALLGVVTYCATNAGSYGEAVKWLTKRTGRTQFIQNVHQWLHPDPAKRVEPRFGMGLLLLDFLESHATNRRVFKVPLIVKIKKKKKPSAAARLASYLRK